MDPALQEIMLSARDGFQLTEAIIKLTNPAQPPAGTTLVTRFGDIATCRIPSERIGEVWADEAVVSLKAPRYVAMEPSLYAEDTFPDAQTLSSADKHPYTGKGIVVGIIDWGFDFTHPNFLNKDGSTRFLAIWDQTASPDPSANKYGYGRIIQQAQINEALRAARPFDALGYHPAIGDPDGSGAHGTHVADIACGNGSVGVKGVASEAHIVGVHLSAGNTGGLASLGDSVRILEAIDFIAGVAGERSLVINLSVGKHGGSHQGNSLVEQGMDNFLREKPGRAIVNSAGNYYSADIHASGRVSPGDKTTLQWEVDENDKTPNELEIWYSSRDTFAVSLYAPDNSISPVKIELGKNKDVLFKGQLCGRAYHRAKEPNTGDHHVDIFLYNNAPKGNWRVQLDGLDVVDGRFHSWIERDSGCMRCQSKFPEKESDRNYTTGSICNGLFTITVGAYAGNDPLRSPAFFSSAGPTADGRQKPNLLAPGVNIRAARSSLRNAVRSRGELTTKTGTSMAAPHVTGAIACFFQAMGKPLSIKETRRHFLSSLAPSPVGIEPNHEHRYGLGYLSMEALFTSNTPYFQPPFTSSAMKDYEFFLEEELESESMDDDAFDYAEDADHWTYDEEGYAEDVDDWAYDEEEYAEDIDPMINDDDENIEDEFDLWDNTHPKLDEAKAIRDNKTQAEKQGWGKYREAIHKYLGLRDDANDGDLARAIFDWQLKNGFEGKAVDGVIGKNTWKTLRKVVGIILVPPVSLGNALDKILEVAVNSDLAGYSWKDKEEAPIAYTMGMALTYARVYCKYKAGDLAALRMGKADTGIADKDVLTHYKSQFKALGMINDADGVDTLRHLFVLLTGLGIRESFGKYCLGLYKPDGNTAHNTAEAGLFQTSYNISYFFKGDTKRIFDNLYSWYKLNPDSGFLDPFKHNVSCKPSDWKNHGTGEGVTFQELSKKCPAFTAEVTAMGLRIMRNHWAPVKNDYRVAEIRKECDEMFIRVQDTVDKYNLHSLLLPSGIVNTILPAEDYPYHFQHGNENAYHSFSAYSMRDSGPHASCSCKKEHSLSFEDHLGQHADCRECGEYLVEQASEWLKSGVSSDFLNGFLLAKNPSYAEDFSVRPNGTAWARQLFDHIAFSKPFLHGAHIDETFHTVAMPGELLPHLIPGDVVLTRSMGEGKVWQAMAVTGELLNHRQAEMTGLVTKSAKSGVYMEVLPAYPMRRHQGNGYAKRIGDEQGRLLRDCTVIRARMGDDFPSMKELSGESTLIKIGWSDASPNGTSGIVPMPPIAGWNAGEWKIGKMRRIPIEGLRFGSQDKDSRHDMTIELAKGKAIVILHEKFNPERPADIVLYFHGDGPGYRQAIKDFCVFGAGMHKGCLNKGGVEDVETARIAEQIESGSSAQIMAILPQYTRGKANMGSSFNCDQYINEVLQALAPFVYSKTPPVCRVILAGHSRGGEVARLILTSSRQLAPSKLAMVALFDGIHGNTWSQSMVSKHLERDLISLKAFSSDIDRLNYLKSSYKFLAYHAGNSYVSSHRELNKAIRTWFKIKQTANPDVSGQVWTKLAENYQVIDAGHNNHFLVGVPMPNGDPPLLDALKRLSPMLRNCDKITMTGSAESVSFSTKKLEGPGANSKMIHIYNTELNAPYIGGNFDFLYNPGAGEAYLVFRTWLDYRKNFTEAQKSDFRIRLQKAVDAWDGAAEVQIQNSAGDYSTKIRLRFMLEIVQNPKFANKKTDVHPSGYREKVLRQFNVAIDSTFETLAHELGHVWGLEDEYNSEGFNGWFQKRLPAGHVGPDSPLLKDVTALMNQAADSEFRGRYFRHIGRKLLEAFWGIDEFMHPVFHDGKVVATTIHGRINLLKRDINANPPYNRDIPLFNPRFVIFQISKRGNHIKRKLEYPSAKSIGDKSDYFSPDLLQNERLEDRQQSSDFLKIVPQDANIQYDIFPDGYIRRTVPVCAEDLKSGEIEYYYSSNNNRYFIAKLHFFSVEKRNNGKPLSIIPKGYISKEQYPPGGDAQNKYVYKNGDIVVDGISNGKPLFIKYSKAPNEFTTLVRMPDALKKTIGNIKLFYSFKDTQRRYCDPDAFAGFIGALAEMSFEDVQSTGMCFADATSFPSISHPNGDSIDTAYLYDSGQFSKVREQQKINAFRKFNFKNIIRGCDQKFTGLTGHHHCNSKHNNHLHAGDFDKKMVFGICTNPTPWKFSDAANVPSQITAEESNTPPSAMFWGEGNATPAGIIPSSRLAFWDTDEKTDFMKKVYEAQLHRSVRLLGTTNSRTGEIRVFYPGLPDRQLAEVEEGYKMETYAAAACKALLAKARADLASEQSKGIDLAARAKSIGITSAYRSLDHDFTAWQKAFKQNFKRGVEKEWLSDNLDAADIKKMVEVLANTKAIPGFSNHTKGISVDFKTTVKRGRSWEELGANKDHRGKWKQSWLFDWLTRNGKSFSFVQLPSEEWHWDYLT